MAITTSIAQLRKIGIVLRSDEAVAIAQQLIHRLPLAGDSRAEPPFGPSSDNVYVDAEGFVTCRAYEATPAVPDMALFLQMLLPAGTPRVPGALRYMIARALHDVDAPPFDSIEDFSDGLARFECGDRTAVVRALVARATSAGVDGLQLMAREDRRRRMPSASDFRRELRAADARLYAQVALHVVPPAPPPAPPRWRVSTITAGIIVGLGLIGAGELMHTRSLPSRDTGRGAIVSASEPTRDRDPALGQAQGISSGSRDERVARQLQGNREHVIVVPAAVPVATTGSRIENPQKPAAKRSVRRASSATAPRTRRAKATRGVLDRLRLRWLRNAITLRSDPF